MKKLTGQDLPDNVNGVGKNKEELLDEYHEKLSKVGDWELSDQELTERTWKPN